MKEVRTPVAFLRNVFRERVGAESVLQRRHEAIEDLEEVDCLNALEAKHFWTSPDFVDNRQV